MSDEDDLDSIFDGEAEEVVVEPKPEEPGPEEPTAEEPKAEEPEASEEETPEESPTIPYGVFKSSREDLKDVRSQLEQATKQIAELSQPKPEPKPAPDFFEDPDGYRSHFQQQQQQLLLQNKLEQSKFFAEREFGKETIDEVMAYFDTQPREASAQFLSHASPMHAAVEFYKTQKVAREIGTDPDAYKQRIVEEARREWEAEQATKQAQEMAQAAPPSMAKTPGTGGATPTIQDVSTDLDDIFGT